MQRPELMVKCAGGGGEGKVEEGGGLRGEGGGGEGDSGGGQGGGGEGGGAGQVETVPETPPVRVGQEQTEPPPTSTLSPDCPAEFPLMLHAEMATVPPPT